LDFFEGEGDSDCSLEALDVFFADGGVTGSAIAAVAAAAAPLLLVSLVGFLDSVTFCSDCSVFS